MSLRETTDSGTLRTALAVARVEWLRFLRRDALVALPIAWALGAAVLVPLPAPSLVVSPWPWWLAAVVLWERLRNGLVAIEAVALATTALVYAWWSLDRDRRNDAWRIVQHAPSGRGGLLLGRALGVVGCVALMHAVFATIILSTVPVFHRSGASLLLEIAGPLMLAVTLVPDGLVATQQAGQRAGRYVALRIAQAARFVVPVIVALAFTSGTTLGARVQVATDAIVRYLDGSDALVALSAAVSSPGLLLAALAAWQLASTLVLWRLYIVREPIT
jgi:hypothetical protein